MKDAIHHCTCCGRLRRCGNCGGFRHELVNERTFLQELRDANVRRAPDFHAGDLHDWSLAERGNELAGETGELCNELKKLLRFDKRVQSGDYILEDMSPRYEILQRAATELADVIICADLIAAQLGIDIAEAVRAKFNATSDKIGSKVKL